MSSLTDILTNISNAIPELTSSSVTSIWRKLASALSVIIDNVIQELTNTEDIINANIAANNYGKAGYYINAALAYEDGVNMVIDPTTQNWIYDPVDTSKETITQAAFEEASLTLKVAYTDPSTGLLAKLPDAVMTRFLAYMTEAGSGGIEIPGIPLNVVSLDPNVFNANFVITYYGSYSLVNIQSAVIVALNTFRDSFAYNGELFINDISDYLKQNVPGIRDVSISSATIDSVPFSGSVSLLAGYFNFDSSLITSLGTNTPYVAI